MKFSARTNEIIAASLDVKKDSIKLPWGFHRQIDADTTDAEIDANASHRTAPCCKEYRDILIAIVEHEKCGLL